MLYKVPMPTRHNGVKIVKIGDHQIGIEYQTGEPHVGKMAFDSSCGILSKNITFDAMPTAGKPRLGTNEVKADTMEYDDDASKVIGNLLSYLAKYLDPEQMDGVKLILGSAEAPDNDAGEPHQQAADRRRAARLAADAAWRRPMSTATEREYSEMFPHSGRLG